MANTINWGQGSVNNTNGWGKGAIDNTNGWGQVYPNTPTGETNIGVNGDNDFFLLLEIDDAFLLLENGENIIQE